MTSRRLTTEDAASIRALIWLGIYLAAVTVPLFALLPGPAPGSGFLWDFAMALGYAGAAMLGVQFALTARFKRATAPFGIDIVYYFHRYLALAALAMVLAHYALARWSVPGGFGSLDPREAPGHLTAGRVALLIFVALVLSSMARRALRIEYDFWRRSHALLATLGFALAIAHVLGAARYLDAPWKWLLWVSYAAFWLALIGYVRVLRPWRLARRPWRVLEVRRERGNVHTMALAPDDGRRLRFAPGQFVWLTLRASPWAMREHPFSIASSAERGDRIELAIKALGDFTSTLGSVPPGEPAWVDAPYGTFGIDHCPQAEGYAFVAGGVGIAPVLSMLRTLADRRDRRPLWLFYGNRSWDRVAFREELERLRAGLELTVIHLLQEPPPDWTGERGLLTKETLARHLPPQRSQLEYFICGPTPMTHVAEAALAALGVPARRVHSEIFDWV
jgi:predicted ferric reductase